MKVKFSEEETIILEKKAFVPMIVKPPSQVVEDEDLFESLQSKIKEKEPSAMVSVDMGETALSIMKLSLYSKPFNIQLYCCSVSKLISGQYGSYQE